MRADHLIIAGAAIAVIALAVWGFTFGEYPLEANVFPALAAGSLALFGLLAWREPLPEHDPGAFSWPAVAWIAAVLPAIYLFGFRIGLPLYSLIYALACRTHPLAATILSAAVGVVIEILFVLVLKFPLGPGWLVKALLR